MISINTRHQARRINETNRAAADLINIDKDKLPPLLHPSCDLTAVRIITPVVRLDKKGISGVKHIAAAMMISEWWRSALVGILGEIKASGRVRVRFAMGRTPRL